MRGNIWITQADVVAPRASRVSIRCSSTQPASTSPFHLEHFGGREHDLHVQGGNLLQPAPWQLQHFEGRSHGSLGLSPFWSSGFASAAAYWRVEQSPPIIFIYLVERFAMVLCCHRPTVRPAFLAAVPESCSAANLVEYPTASAAIGMARMSKYKTSGEDTVVSNIARVRLVDASLYLAIATGTTVGFGDIHARKSVEQFAGCLVPGFTLVCHERQCHGAVQGCQGGWTDAGSKRALSSITVTIPLKQSSW